MGDEIGEIGTRGQMPRKRSRSVQGDDHRPRPQLAADPYRDLANVSIRHRQNDDFGALKRRVSRDRVKAETAFQSALADVGHLDMPD